MRNSSGDRAFSGTVQLEKRFGSGAEVTLAYTYTDARDRMSPDCFRIDCNLDFDALDGTLNDRRLSTSSFDPGTRSPSGRSRTFRSASGWACSTTATQASRTPTWFEATRTPTGSDVNDAMYVPKNAGDITLADPEQWAGFDTLIRSQPCLDAQRGHVMRRNSCRGGWATLLNAQVSRLFALGRGHSLELTVDLFNVLNFFNRNWGVQRTFLLEPQTQPSILERVGYDQANQRGMYNFYPPDRKARDEEATRWRMQLGARYAF